MEWAYSVCETDEQLACVVKVVGPSKKRGRRELMELSIPVDDVRMEWAYSVCETDEQLAMLLAHEMSHVVHEHGRDATYLHAVILGIQLVLLSLLDVTGLVSMLTVLECLQHCGTRSSCHFPATKSL